MRRQALRRNWRDLIVLGAILTGAVLATALLSGALQLMGAFILGVTSMLAAVIWILGGDVWSLPPAWGAIGEEQTGKALDRLDESWWVEHDIPHGYGNYDHVAIGPPGVFLLETKRLSRPAAVRNDELRAGGMRYSGAGFRRAAVTMAEALGAALGSRPWVQPVVVVWGKLTDGTREESRVIYLQGEHLVAWLRAQPIRLTREHCDRLAAAVARLQENSGGT